VQEAVDATVQAALAIRSQDLRRDDAIELQVSELEDLAHATGADALDRLEAVE
jgi:hypothetical protein